MIKYKTRIRIALFRITPFVVVWRLFNSFHYKKESFSIKSKLPFTLIYEENRWNYEESVSGGGSTLLATTTLRSFLPKFFLEYDIHSILDIPCGDYNWMSLVEKKDIAYIGADIVEPLVELNNKKYSADNVSFKVIDLTKDSLPQVDLIFCKDCLQHLSHEKVFSALKNIKNSGSKYLLTTSYPLTLRNWDILDGDYRPLNILKKPFLLSNPLLKIQELSKEGGNELDKTMYLWEIKSLPDFI